jgi:hypothetical protein
LLLTSAFLATQAGMLERYNARSFHDDVIEGTILSHNINECYGALLRKDRWT